ncbi:hypothetical protein [Actibacterium mucosum]|nr:hypothetical protein [Actibacterium mucosum]
MDLFSTITFDQLAYSALAVLLIREAMVVLLPAHLVDSGDN